ncbi:hypothetical protein [Trichlorobacter ammonificans]|uniref:Uncharacterized protein n=1 Tax=Trichlorobacter ammonificans TaxID=2916410 RepID=A0ABM9D7R0_9BACT|nr:hypothetical protein [Trichlorobacter ammonificans]CAH2031255.1 conserved protein of unknown function [Trichlorobacter ammonificans]
MTGACHSPTASLSRFSPSPVEYGVLLQDLAGVFNPLHPDCLIDFQVTSIRDGIAVFSVAMPEAMVRGFAAMLTSQAELFRFIEHKRRSVSARIKVHDLNEIAKREKFHSDNQRLIVETFDELVKQGASTNDAIKLTNRKLKDRGHPWACYNTVAEVVRSAGRLRTFRRKSTPKEENAPC